MRHLRGQGCELIREGGRHSWWRNDRGDRRSAIPRRSGSKDLPGSRSRSGPIEKCKGGRSTAPERNVKTSTSSPFSGENPVITVIGRRIPKGAPVGTLAWNRPESTHSNDTLIGRGDAGLLLSTRYSREERPEKMPSGTLTSSLLLRSLFNLLESFHDAPIPKPVGS